MPNHTIFGLKGRFTEAQVVVSEAKRRPGLLPDVIEALQGRLKLFDIEPSLQDSNAICISPRPSFRCARDDLGFRESSFQAEKHT